jgi:hypothetical protein
MQKAITFFLASILMVVLLFSNVMPAWASSSLNPIHNIALSQTYMANSQSDQVQKHLILEKRICRYVDGYKRCWDT